MDVSKLLYIQQHSNPEFEPFSSEGSSQDFVKL